MNVNEEKIKEILELICQYVNGGDEIC